MAPIARLRDYSGPAILSYGFRPFFLFGSLHAGLAILLWLAMLTGSLDLPTEFSPLDWHVHEMLYGFLPAVITGFLLTAIPNWTGRLPLQGRPLLGLVVAWLAGRVAVSLSAWIGWLPSAVIDVAFLLLVAVVVAREIVAGKNWRNLKVLGVLVALSIGNAVFHIEAHGGGADLGVRLGIGAMVLLVLLIGGRIVPSFTRNWLVRENPGRLPAPYDRLDTFAMTAAGGALALWIAAPDHPATGAALIAGGLVQAARLARWAGDRTLRDPLVLILHLAYGFAPIGFVLVGLSSFGVLPVSAGLHAWTGGALGAMTLAVMSRASLGHTGRALAASAAVRVIYALVIVSVLARIGAAMVPIGTVELLSVAGLAWAAAFLGFAASYWAILTGPRQGALAAARAPR